MNVQISPPTAYGSATRICPVRRRRLRSSRSSRKKSGEGRSLTPDQEAHIRKLIADQRPEQLKMDFALWTRAAVGQLIAREFKIVLSVRGVGKYLKRWGFTPQKPIKKAYEQCPRL